MDKPMRNLNFVGMSFLFKLRDLMISPKSKLEEAGIERRHNVLDFGCGPGSFALAAARSVGEKGLVYALDIHPLAIRKVQERASKRGLSNIRTILSDGQTGLENDSIDIVLLYDTFHDLSDPDGVLEELHRVMKKTANLSFSDHHMEERSIVSSITEGGLFELLQKGKRTYTFRKAESGL